MASTTTPEPISPRDAVGWYLNSKQLELNKAKARTHGVGLEVFVKWTEEAGIDQLNQLTDQRITEYREWWEADVGYGALDFERNEPILRPFFDHWAEEGRLEAGLSLTPVDHPGSEEGDQPQAESQIATPSQPQAPPEDFQQEREVDALNERQTSIYLSVRERFETYLREQGKVPRKSIGYAEDSIGPRVSRIQRVFDWLWESEEVTTELSTDHADRFLEALDTDSYRAADGERYSEASKRKFRDTLENWFEFHDVEWEPTIRFTDDDAIGDADPFSRAELRKLWQAALQYKSIPSYNNLSPTERDRWRAYIAQELGKPKEEVSPADWEAINQDWKIPSLIRTTRAAGWRPAMVARLRVDWYDDSTQTIHIPQGQAVKNDAAWAQALDDESAFALENWLEQRENLDKYDGRNEIWLNRQENSYQSGSLNTLLRNLMGEADIEPYGRKLVWYSFRHSIGTYVYDEYKDLKIVAETLRQKSRASADRYVHPTPELKREAAGVM